MDEKTLMQYLEDINTCKENIKNALKDKDVNMSGVTFNGYAQKIRDLQLVSGDTPSTPTPSVDYIYSNGYLTNGNKRNEIVTLVPYEIELDDKGECSFELTCPDEISVDRTSVV